jgi:hypothetical protein
MPAYRSPAEGEIREAVVAHLRARRPSARIIHEINAVNMRAARPTRIDVLAVDREEIVAVEIKSARDKLDRLPAQMEAMQSVAHHAIAALHEKFLVECPTNEHAAHYERDGAYYLMALPSEPARLHRASAWVYPLRARALRPDYDCLARWDLSAATCMTPLPEAALDMLWREELADLCSRLKVATGRRSTRTDMMRELRWQCSGKEITRGICAALRARECVEADPPIRDTGRAG